MSACEHIHQGDYHSDHHTAVTGSDSIFTHTQGSVHPGPLGAHRGALSPPGPPGEHPATGPPSSPAEGRGRGQGVHHSVQAGREPADSLLPAAESRSSDAG